MWEKWNRGRTENKGKWASFTRPRLVPKAGRGMESWLKRQQVRHKSNKQHKQRRQRKQPTGRAQKSLLQQRESLPAWPWGLCCPTFIKSLYGFYMLLPGRRAIEINKKVEDIYVREAQEEQGKRWCRATTLLIINTTNCSNQSWLSLPEQGNTCMIIVKDSPNCLCNATGSVTDTAWLKPHKAVSLL